jgi:hypothetical protein
VLVTVGQNGDIDVTRRPRLGARAHRQPADKRPRAMNGIEVVADLPEGVSEAAHREETRAVSA